MIHYLRLSHHVTVPNYLIYTFDKLKYVSDNYVNITDVVFNGVEVRLFEPPAKGDARLKCGAIYIHGGGWAWQRGAGGQSVLPPAVESDGKQQCLAEAEQEKVSASELQDIAAWTASGSCWRRWCVDVSALLMGEPFCRLPHQPLRHCLEIHR